MHCESVEDEFELFRAQSYGVESVIRHQRAASVRASAKAKLIQTHGDVERQPPEVVPQPRPAAERKASFKSSARRRIYQQRIPEEGGDDQATSGPSNMHDGGGDGADRPLSACATEGRPVAVDDIALLRRPAGDFENDDDAEGTSQDVCRVYRMRSFYTKSGNIVNRGDSMRVRTPTSDSARRTRDAVSSPPSTGSSISVVVPDRESAKRDDARFAVENAPNTTVCWDTSRDLLTVSYISGSGPTRRQRMNNANESSEDIAASAYRVLVLGSQGVGKTTLTEQLMTSEYLANKESFAGMIHRHRFSCILVVTFSDQIKYECNVYGEKLKVIFIITLNYTQERYLSVLLVFSYYIML